MRIKTTGNRGLKAEWPLTHRTHRCSRPIDSPQKCTGLATPREAIGSLRQNMPICDRIPLTVHRRPLPVEVGVRSPRFIFHQFSETLPNVWITEAMRRHDPFVDRRTREHAKSRDGCQHKDFTLPHYWRTTVLFPSLRHARRSSFPFFGESRTSNAPRAGLSGSRTIEYTFQWQCGGSRTTVGSKSPTGKPPQVDRFDLDRKR
jgi:hypothetical protein